MTIVPGAFQVLKYWVQEREAIRAKKESGQPKPWTADPILQRFRFCNVRREDDKVTRWIHQHIRLPYLDHPALWFMLCVARQINHPPTLQELMLRSTMDPAWPDREGFTPEAMTVVLDRRRTRGDQIYTGAYMIRAESNPKAPWFSWTKQRYIAEIVLGKVWEDRAVFDTLFKGAFNSLQGTHTQLMRHIGWGPFMAYQAVVDMRFTPLLGSAPDLATWAAAGPGTLRGLNRLHGLMPGTPRTQGKALEGLRELWPLIMQESGVEMDFSDVPNILCEFDKYLRVQNNEGKPRSLYPGV